MVIFIYSLLLTSLVSFFAVMIIPDSVRMSNYGDDLIGGLAMFMVGPLWARIALRAFVVFVGFLILAGAVNTAIDICDPAPLRRSPRCAELPATPAGRESDR